MINAGFCLLRDQWVETHLEETDEADVLMLPEDVSSLNVDGYVAHPLFALVVLVEYTIRYVQGRGQSVVLMPRPGPQTVPHQPFLSPTQRH